jgi:hypothetical protein
MARTNLLAVEVSVSQKTIDTLLSRKTLTTLLPRSLPDDVLVSLWRSMHEQRFNPKRTRLKHDADAFAAAWVRAVAVRSGLPPEKAEYCFSEILEEAREMVCCEVAYRVSNGLCEDLSRSYEGRFVRWLRILRKGGG